MRTDDVNAVASELRRYEEKFDKLLAMIEGKRQLSEGERLAVQERYRALKGDIKHAAKTGTIGAQRRQRTPAEDAFFDPAVRGASCQLVPAVSTHPITSNWHGALYGARIDISYYLHQLEK